ncbi:MAG: thiamine diphosphokinase [Coriobacteriia bacterium]|nr:thiamine diphosphokinase [Coriobacteriia bacterium]
MKALLVAAAPVSGSVPLVAQLASGSDLVIAVDGGGGVCLDAGVTPDVVLGDFDSLPAEQLEWLRSQGTRVVEFSAKKDATDLELALTEARAAGATRVVVTCATAGRLDHTLAVMGALARSADLRPTIVEPQLAAWVLCTDARCELRLGLPGTTLSLVALIGSAVVSATGVEWPLDRAMLSPLSGLGVSNVVTSDDGCVVTVHEGVLLVLAPQFAGAQSGAP